MYFLKLITQCTFLYILCILGETIQAFTHFPLPGSLIGMSILFLFLSLKIIPLQWVDTGATRLLSVMTLFLVPAAVGLMNYGTFFLREGLVLLGITFVSTIIVFFIAGHTGQYLATRQTSKDVSLKKEQSL